MNLIGSQAQTRCVTREWTSLALTEAQTCCVKREWTSLVLIR